MHINMGKKSVLSIIVWKSVGFVLFLVLLGIANIIMPFVHSTPYADVIRFFNGTLILMLMILFVGMLNEILWTFDFPSNILAPLSASVLSMVLVTFFYKFWKVFNAYIDPNFVINISLVYIVVAVTVLLLGFLTLLIRHGKPKDATIK